MHAYEKLSFIKDLKKPTDKLNLVWKYPQVVEMQVRLIPDPRGSGRASLEGGWWDF